MKQKIKACQLATYMTVGKTQRERRIRLERFLKLVLIVLVVSMFFPLLTLGCEQPTAKQASLPRPAQPAEPPGWIKENSSAYTAYRKAVEIMGDPRTSREEKQKRMRVLQRSVGDELLVTVIRYVPVYDDASGKYITFDEYMRRMAREYPVASPDVPLAYDPVGATMLIFFDPSPQTIAAVTGIGLSPEEVKRARAQFDKEQKQRAKARAEKEAQLKKAWEQFHKNAGQVAQEVRRQTERAARDVQRELERQSEEARRQTERAARDVQRELEKQSEEVRRQIERATREAQRELEKQSKEVRRQLEDLFKRRK